MELWRVTQPDRVFCLVSEDSTLVIQAVEAARVSISLASAAETERLLASSSKAKQICRVQGCLGLLNHGSDIFLCVVESAITVGSLQRQDSVFRVASVSFHCGHSLKDLWWFRWLMPLLGLNTGRFDLDALLPSTGGHGLQPNPGNEQQQTYIEHPCASISRILTNGNFYFSSVVDLSSSLEARLRRGNDRASSYNPQFLWNHYLLSSLLSFRSNLTSTEQDAFDRAGFLLMAIQGYIGNVDIQVSGSDTLSLSVISRLSWHRAGTRFNSRGIDDEGAVANFVETETVVRTATSAMSYIQLRGSVPLFWEQQATQPWATKVQLTRPAIASQPAFNKHFDDLLKHYPRVHICNLLGTRDHESQLTRVYEAHLRTLTSEDPDFATRLQLTNFDFHARARKGGGIESIEEQLSRERSLMAATDRFSFCMASQSKKGYELVSSQEGVFRTNCLDCLDRTNVIQTCLSQNAVRTFVSSINPEWFRSESLWAMHRNLFAENGDALARIYAGTGALNTSFTRQGKRTLAGVLSDAGKSVGRVIQSNFADAGKQAAIDELLVSRSEWHRQDTF